jgi:hypothetical protein
MIIATLIEYTTRYLRLLHGNDHFVQKFLEYSEFNLTGGELR